MDSNNILEMRSITKTFPGVKALNDVNFKVKKGEIHCLVGENGAGKSTLMKVLSGVHPYGTYEGSIILNGDTQHYKNIAESEAAGIAIIYQELALFPELTLYDNIFFGHEITKGLTIDQNETIIRTSEMLQKVRVNINPSTKVKELSVGKQQLVEIAKALSKDVKLLILDEPTAALNEDDSKNLLEIIKELKEQGVTCIMISHKLKEVLNIADTITILRDGKTICSLSNEDKKVTENEIIKNMVGREIEQIYPPRDKKDMDEVCLEIKDWNAFNPVTNKKILNNININVKKGEIVGIAGLMGAGRTELALSIFGNPTGYKINGEIFLDGKKINSKNPGSAIKLGIAYVSEDRKKNGLILIQDIKKNITIANLRELAKVGVIDQNKEIGVANEYKESINIKAPSIEQTVGNLSGGNQQKVSIAKWLFVTPKVLILDEPTRGIDVGAKYEIYTIMNKLVDQGMSIIMISSELLEVIGMSDRIYVMSDGKLAGELGKEEATEENIMRLATV